MKKWNAAARRHGYGSQNTSDFREQTSSTKGTHTSWFVFHRLQGKGFSFFIGRRKGDLMTLFLKHACKFSFTSSAIIFLRL